MDSLKTSQGLPNLGAELWSGRAEELTVGLTRFSERES